MTDSTNYILAYHQAIQNGSVLVGKKIKQLYETIVDGVESGRWFFDVKKANNSLAFIERFCHHNKGPLAPQRIKLQLWQKAMLSCIFGIVDAEGKRQFTEVNIVIGRKQGKTLIAAGIATYMAFVAGEFGSDIYFLAPKLDQADLCFGATEFNILSEQALAKRTKSTKYKGLYIKDSNTSIKKLAFSDRKSDGYNPMLYIADETAAWPAARGLKQWEVMASGTGSRDEPLGAAISSAGYENDGVYDELYKRGTAFLNGNSREEHLLPVIYEIDDINKWDDINELRKSLPGLGVSVSVKFILKEIEIAYGSISKKLEFLTKYCNVKQNSTASWLARQDIQKSFPGNNFTFEDFHDCYAVGGVDLSMTTDLTAACVLIEKNGILYYFTHFWLPVSKLKEATERDGIPYEIYIKRGFLTLAGENSVDYHSVTEWFLKLLNEYKIYPLKCGFDVYSSPYFVGEMQNNLFHMESVRQGPNLTSVIVDAEGKIKDGILQCADDNDLMKLHWIDSALKLEDDTARRSLKKVSKNAHVDGVAALLDALCMRHAHFEELGVQLRNED